jgi:thiamine biosynthesis protein ThiS
MFNFPQATCNNGRQENVMEIICNGTKTEVSDELCLLPFLRGIGLNPDTVAVECDGVILARETYDGVLLREGMVLEVIRFVGGGAIC